MGASIQQGTQTFNIGRLAALAGGLPETCAGMSIDRQCSSGLMTIATAAKQIVQDEMTVLVAGGVENITLVQNEHMNFHRIPDPRLLAAHPNTHMSMLETAEIVAKKFGISQRGTGRVRPAESAAHCSRAGCRQVRRRDHPGDHRQVGDRQGQRRDPH